MFDVIVTENMFGDILTDEASVLAGSMGLLPSASAGRRTHEQGRLGLYRAHPRQRRPDHCRQGIANPLRDLLSAAMLLRYSLVWRAEATAVERAVQRAVTAGYRTKDIAGKGKPSTTSEVGEAVANFILG